MEQVLDTCMDGAVSAKINAFDLEDFECTQFGMFLGTSKWITLQVNEQKMMNPLYDHFGDRLKGHVAPTDSEINTRRIPAAIPHASL